MNVSPLNKYAQRRTHVPISVMSGRKHVIYTKQKLSSIDDDDSKSSKNSNSSYEVMEENQKLRAQMKKFKKKHIKEIEEICGDNEEDVDLDPKSLLSKMMRQSLYAEDIPKYSIEEDDNNKIKQSKIEIYNELNIANHKIKTLEQEIKEKDILISKLKSEINILQKKVNAKQKQNDSSTESQSSHHSCIPKPRNKTPKKNTSSRKTDDLLLTPKPKSNADEFVFSDSD